MTVRDRGPGIAEQDLPHIFNPFIRGDSIRGGQGAGLGLAIVQRIVAMHDGSIELANHAEGGLEVKISLPLENLPKKPKLRDISKSSRWKRSGQGSH